MIYLPIRLDLTATATSFDANGVEATVALLPIECAILHSAAETYGTLLRPFEHRTAIPSIVRMVAFDI